MMRTAIAALALVVPAAAGAHSFWLQPEDHTPTLREEVRVDFKVGDLNDGGDGVSDWGLYWERIGAFQLHEPNRVYDQQNAVRTTDEGEAGSATIALIEPGTHVLAFASNPSFSDLEAERFDAYVEHEGLAAISAHRAKRTQQGLNGTELYARRAKALFQVGDILSEHVTQPVGQTLEIVPLVNPFEQVVAEAGPAPLPLKVFWRGQPLANATVFAAPLNQAGDAARFVTGSDGVATIPQWSGEPTLFSVVWGVPAPSDSRADYLTIFASLTVGR
ncbi:MAG: DUF4198 domain-containing protein [Erythrobacter sp.]